MAQKEEYNVRELLNQSLEYFKDKAAYYRLFLMEKSSREIAILFSSIILVFLGGSVLFFFSTALAVYLGILWNSYPLGLAAIGGGYLFLFLLFVILKKPLIEKQFQNSFIKRNFSEKE